jgi:uncharacterized protein (DUF924 family)
MTSATDPNAWTTESAVLLELWLGPLDEDGLASPEAQRRWFTKDLELDTEIRRRFGAVLESRARTGSAGASPREKLASTILFDQLPRNMFRDTPRMYAYDAAALAVAKDLVDSGEEARLAPHERLFVYMPYMHSEALDDQEACVRLFTTLRDALTGRAKEAIAFNLQYAIAHRDIIARFGRFPHRNAILGRPSTDEELAFLEEPGSSF